ncbi:oligosaccharide flippase family protein [Methylobacterium currus]|uniref:oligosaccharide flippase family protein n=1 Tax=Methylobacterium currus TaxID=2051553 RepID=UPI001E48E51B|nr:oligosaccharide flippase family protein [Methylobacterium currus]UHC16689.1 oligosaccharide flippase family protein [Methylobacterium currus]
MLGPLVWSLLNTAATVLIPFGLFTVFARTGEAWQVGAVGIAISIAEIVKTLCPQGFYEVLLHRDIRREQDEAAFGFLLLSGGMAALAYLAVLGVTGHHLPDVRQILPALMLLAPKILFDVLAIQPQACAVRRGDAKLIAKRTIVSNSVAAAFGISFALAGKSLFGLVSYYLVQSVAGFALMIWVAGAPVRPRLRWSPIRGLLKEAGYASGVRLVGAANSYADTLVVAAFVAPALVGAYNLAKRIETVLMSASASFSAIMYQPAFATHDGASRRVMIENAVTLTTLIIGLPTILFVVFNRDWIVWVFGARWIEAGPICALAALSGLARTYGAIHGAILSVTGRNRALLVNAAGSAVTGLSLVAALAGHGLVWAAGAVAMKSIVFCLSSAVLTMPSFASTARLYLRGAVLPLGAAAVAAAGLERMIRLIGPLPEHWAAPLAILLTVTLFAACMAHQYRDALGRIRRRGR